MVVVPVQRNHVASAPCENLLPTRTKSVRGTDVLHGTRIGMPCTQAAGSIGTWAGVQQGIRTDHGLSITTAALGVEHRSQLQQVQQPFASPRHRGEHKLASRSTKPMAPVETKSSRCLLLLPPPPAPPSYAALKVAYHAPLLTVLRELAHSSGASDGSTVLEIALPCPHLYGNEDVPRSAAYGPTQSLVSALYKLICVISAKESIDVEGAEGVDARVILVSYPRNANLDHVREGRPEDDLLGPVIDIQTLARSGRDWNTVYCVQSETGEQLLKVFTTVGKPCGRVHRVRGGIIRVSSDDEESAAAPETTQEARRHYSIAVGGTFDHLHIGHKLLLTMFAFTLDRTNEADVDVERSLTIGITGDELLKNKKYAEFLESWHDRQRSVYDFTSSIMDFSPPGQQRVDIQERSEPGPNGHAVHITLPSKVVIKCVEIWDPFGPTITDESISALVLSGETRAGGKAVNSKRAEKGWPGLEVFEVDVLDTEEDDSHDAQRVQDKKVDEAFASKISSTEIRRLQSQKAQAHGLL